MFKFENHSNYNCAITTSTGEVYKIYANWMHNNKLDQFKDWVCSAGTTRVYIDKNLEVYSGECKNDHLGSALDNHFTLLDQTICRRETCTGCTDDLMVSKHKLTYENR